MPHNWKSLIEMYSNNYVIKLITIVLSGPLSKSDSSFERVTRKYKVLRINKIRFSGSLKKVGNEKQIHEYIHVPFWKKLL